MKSRKSDEVYERHQSINALFQTRLKLNVHQINQSMRRWEIDKKQLSEEHRGRLRARIEELTNSLCTNDYPEENLQRQRVARSEANFRVA